MGGTLWNCYQARLAEGNWQKRVSSSDRKWSYHICSKWLFSRATLCSTHCQCPIGDLTPSEENYDENHIGADFLRAVLLTFPAEHQTKHRSEYPATGGGSTTGWPTRFRFFPRELGSS